MADAIQAADKQPGSHESVSVHAGGARYEAIIGTGLLSSIGSRLVGIVRGPRCVVVADKNTAQLFGEKVLASLRAAWFGPAMIRVPAGESSKSLEQLRAVCDEMAAAGLDRSSFVVALGGGVVGDLAGFAAAIYHRGISLVQVPTTLLAQVDSAVGGKTGVNTAAGKNILGAIRQPALVLVDVETLGTLPARELRQGLAETIKHGVIVDPSLLDAVSEVMRLSKMHPGEAARWNLVPFIRRNIEIKAAIVEQDEQDVSSARAVLNFGHTVGHAIEKVDGYRHFLHAEAVSLGMVAACEISVRKAGFPKADRQRVLDALQAAELPTSLPSDFPRDAILDALAADKKFERGEVRFVVASRLGSARLTSDVTMGDIRAAVALL